MCRSIVMYSQAPQQARTTKSVKSFARIYKEEKLKAYKG